MTFGKAFILVVVLLFAAASTGLVADGTISVPENGDGGIMPWWGWSLILFGFCIVLGIVAVIAGVGGGVLFVPIVSAIFPFHFDFVRGAGMLVAVCGALAGGQKLLRKGLASMRLGFPLALFGTAGSIFGARMGLILPDNVVQTLLGFAVIFIVILMLSAKKSEFPDVQKPDALSSALRISGVYYNDAIGKGVDWKIHRTLPGLLMFIFIGFMGGMFGLGAGWANVPALNLFLGAPLKVAIATSGFIITINGTAAAWVYLDSGAVLPLIAVPSVAGMMIGTSIGAQLLPRIQPKYVKWMVIGILLLTGLRFILKGFGIWE
ncbi:MAG: sulfite exporter TauE/SafE family protein [Spirochaetales bacterium]|nr:sulfite exporter TauE/SafE family protein [Spirochaetales bacterium]